MPTTGLYFIPYTSSTPPAYHAIQERLTRLAASTQSSPLPPWNLTHHLFFDTSSLLTPAQNSPSAQPRRYLQFFALPQHVPGKMYVGASPRPIPPANGIDNTTSTDEAMTIISIPTTQTEEFFHTISMKMQPLWAMRMAVRVESGLGFEIGDWKIRIGEIRQTTGGAGQARMRGCVVEVTLDEEDDEDTDMTSDAREAVLGGIWEQLGLEGGKPFVKVAGVGVEKDGFDLLRQYMEMLRFTRV